MNTPISRLLINYSNARRSWEAWLFMANYHLTKPDPNEREYINNNELLHHLRYLAFKNFHIEIYKIVKVSKNNNDNIFNLLEKLIERNNSKRLSAEKNLLKLTKNKNTIKRICDIRDKIYAHLDEDYKSYQKQGVPINFYLDCFVAIEEGIMTLTSLKTLQSFLDKIPSKDDLHF